MSLNVYLLMSSMPLDNNILTKKRMNLVYVIKFKPDNKQEPVDMLKFVLYLKNLQNLFIQIYCFKTYLLFTT